MTPIYEICKCAAASVRVADLRNGGWRDHVPTPSERTREDRADESLARTVLAYIFQGEARAGGRLPIDGGFRTGLGIYLTTAVERFVVAHEFGHLLAGHLTADRPRDGEGWLRKSYEQEFEADEIGALLLMRLAFEEADADPHGLLTFLSAAGPFGFFGIDHLVNRVRTQIEGAGQLVVNDHPPSDERASALRAVVLEMYGPSILQIADSMTAALSSREERILSIARRLDRR